MFSAWSPLAPPLPKNICAPAWTIAVSPLGVDGRAQRGRQRAEARRTANRPPPARACAVRTGWPPLRRAGGGFGRLGGLLAGLVGAHLRDALLHLAVEHVLGRPLVIER